MQKLKSSIVSKFIEKKVTGKEIDFLIYISRFQSDAGKVTGVYYRDVCQALNMSYQTFYDVKESLEKKGFISVRRESDIDYDITILNNDFTDKNFEESYISTRRSVFQDPKFFALKANEKIMLLDLMKITFTKKGSWTIERTRFYEKYHEMFDVTVRVIRMYFKNIKNFFDVFSYNKDYIIEPKNIDDNKKRKKSDELQHDEYAVKAVCRRNKMKEFKPKIITDVAKLIHQYKEIAYCKGKSSSDLVFKIIRECLEHIKVNNTYKKKEKKKKYELNPKYIHKLLRKELELD